MNRKQKLSAKRGRAGRSSCIGMLPVLVFNQKYKGFYYEKNYSTLINPAVGHGGHGTKQKPDHWYDHDK
ncbi:MAG: hypothetical protein MI702_00255 [Chlorobiales bacterium]|nr:hypothetical protein [Chlorobiales bacterium]